MTSQDKRLIIAATAAAVAVGGVAIYYGIQCSKTKKTEKTAEASNEKPLPAVSKQDLIAIFEEITAQMSSIVVQLAKIEQKVRQESAETGTMIPEEQLGAYLMAQFEEAMKSVESAVYSKYSCSEEKVQNAADYYQNDEAVMAVVQKLKQLFGVITGQPMETAEVPEDLTVERVLDIMTRTMEAMNVAMEETCAELLAEGVPSEAGFQDAINRIYIKKAEEATNLLHESEGISRDVLQSAMIKYQQDQEFLQKMSDLQNEQNLRFQAAAAQFGGAMGMAM